MVAERYIVLSGGIGGAKLVLGFAHLLEAEQLTIVANTGDDFEHCGLHIAPDLDTIMYTLAGVVNPDSGWGLANESWHFMDALERIGGETWFRLGDRDLATHARRTALLAAGCTLTEATAALCQAFGVQQRLLPMSDTAVRTRIATDAGTLDFQHYFVRERAAPVVRAVRYDGAQNAEPAPGVAAACAAPELAAIVIAPSNPWLSVAPMLALPGLRAALDAARAPVIAVSPIVGGRAIKGPTAKIMTELGLPSSAPAVARHYQGTVDGFILDRTDECLQADVENLGIRTACCDTVMKTLDHKKQLARFTIEFANSIAAETADKQT